MNWTWLDQRPIVVAIAGPNGAGKTTFFHAHIAPSGLRFVNADLLARQLSLDAYVAADLAGAIRNTLIDTRESFVFETVFSDPVGEKIGFLKMAAQRGYTVVLCFIGLANVAHSAQRVSMRAAQGGHDVPTEKLKSRFPRSLGNLKTSVAELSHVIIFDNTDLSSPFELQAVFENGVQKYRRAPLPTWLRKILP